MNQLLAICCWLLLAIAAPIAAQDLGDPVYVAALPKAESGGATYYGIATQPLVWIKADAQTYNTGDAVTTVTDSSGRANHGGQATAGAKPTFRTGAVNGLPAFYFDGGDCLTNPQIAATTYSAFIVTSNSTTGVLLEHGLLTGLNGYSIAPGIFPPLDVGLRRGSVDADRCGDSDLGKSKWVVIDSIADGTFAGLTLFTNGVDTALGVCTGSADPGTASVTADLFIGARNQSGSFITGHTAEYLLFSPALSGGDHATVRAGIRTKYGL